MVNMNINTWIITTNDSKGLNSTIRGRVLGLEVHSAQEAKTRGRQIRGQSHLHSKSQTLTWCLYIAKVTKVSE